MPVQQMKKLSTKEFSRLPWAKQQAYKLQHGPQPSDEFKAFTALKQRIGGLLAVTATLGIQFAGMCDCTESVAWAGKNMTNVGTATDRIRESKTPADMVKAVKAYAKETGIDKVDNLACNAIQGAVEEIIGFTENEAAELPDRIEAPDLKGAQRGRAVPTRSGPPVGGKSDQEKIADEMDRQADRELDAASAAQTRKEKAIALRKEIEAEAAAEEKKTDDAIATAAKAATDKAAAEKEAADKKKDKKK